MNNDKLKRLLDIGIIIKVYNEEELEQLQKVMEGKISRKHELFSFSFYMKVHKSNSDDNPAAIYLTTKYLTTNYSYPYSGYGYYMSDMIHRSFYRSEIVGTVSDLIEAVIDIDMNEWHKLWGDEIDI